MPDLKSAQADLLRRFHQSMPPVALRALGVLIAFGHLHSSERAIESYGEVGEARCGLLRWIRTDADLLRLMRSGFTGVSAELVENPTNGGMHVEIICGDFRLLVIHDLDPEAPVPHSDYGKAAASKNRYPLFMSDEQWTAEHPAGTETAYTAVLFHSKISTHDLPHILEVRFPNGSGGYQAPPIKLYERFPELQSAEAVDRLYSELTIVAEQEIVEDRAHPQVRKQARQNEA